MKDYLISMYIDDQLNLDEKAEFVETVHAVAPYKDEALDLIRQEKLLRAEVVHSVPPLVSEMAVPRGIRWRRWLTTITAALVLSIAVWRLWPVPQVPHLVAHRFVIYAPQARATQITGSFTNWRPLDLHPAGQSGYWEITLDLPAGEYRFSYLLNGERRIPDPTILVKEKDDFGGENSILEVHA
jgi:hypothetical protein